MSRLKSAGRKKIKTELSKIAEQDGDYQWEAKTPCKGAESNNSSPDDSRQRTALLFCFTFARCYGVIYLPDLYMLEPVLSQSPCI